MAPGVGPRNGNIFLVQRLGSRLDSLDGTPPMLSNRFSWFVDGNIFLAQRLLRLGWVHLIMIPLSY